MESATSSSVRTTGDDTSLSCVFVGDEPLVIQCIEIAEEQSLEVVLVATSNPVVRDYAADRGMTVTGPGAELAAGLQALPGGGADVLFSVSNLRVLPDAVLANVATAVNFHDGPLPEYAGLNVTSWALLAGETEHAITWHVMTAAVDAGDVIVTERFAIDADETAFSLNARCYEAALATFPEVARRVASGDLRATPQPPGEQHLYLRHDRPARLLDPARSAADNVRAVRATSLGSRLRNGIGSVRLVAGDEVVVVDAAHVADASAAAPGTLVETDPHVRIATTDGDVVIDEASTTDGGSIELSRWLADRGLTNGAVLAVAPELVAAVAEVEPALSRRELTMLDRLVGTEATGAPYVGRGDALATAGVDIGDVDTGAMVAAVGLWLARTADVPTALFAVADASVRTALARTAPLTRPPVVAIDATVDTLGALRDEADRQVATLAPLLHDAIGRDPRTRGHHFDIPVLLDVGGTSPVPPDVALHLVAADGRLVANGNPDADDPDALRRIVTQLAAVLEFVTANPSASPDEVDLVTDSERLLLDAINDTSVDYERDVTLDALFATQVAASPDAPALSFGDVTLSYRQLDERVGDMARRLAAVGVGRADRVGIAVPRGIDMVVGVLATLRLGAAYLPLDPTYPPERLEFMVDDAGIKALLAVDDTAVALDRPGVTVVDPAAPAPAGGVPDRTHDATDLAYVIYTSGSTGLPKGVMLEHRQVTNFFVAMDQVIDTDPPGVWLSVTSLSFDISVLELLWTLTRGYHVVLKGDRGVPDVAAATRRAPAAAQARPVTFSLFYFAAGEEAAADGYRLLLESARVADRNGFEAVWTPERHFHAFGGSYPNPSVTGAALAAITENVSIRAGSVVLPLHSPIRVAEEWAVVDNISRGRVAISFAAGWQPNDFVLNPSAYAGAKDGLPAAIDQVKRLWRGETVEFAGHDGAAVPVTTLPRPVQAELPVWLTSAGTPATFERAGKLGVNVLTHLLGQSLERLAENIGIYRAAWRAAGHEGEGRVTLMLHTYLHSDAEVAKATALEPMKSYLGTAVGLLRDVASAFPTFAGKVKDGDDLFKSLTAEELDQLLEVAAHRYLETSGLFGAVDDAVTIVDQAAAAGVDEVACLVDFGVDTDAVLQSLDLLLDCKRQIDERARTGTGEATATITSAGRDSDSVAALVARHGVTHLQCTPSLAAMLVADPADRESLRSIRHLMVGGEALPTALAAELRGLLGGRFTNMYGPTETTIWSLTHEIDGPPGATMPIGRPIANTTIFVLDRHGRPQPVGAFGELHIGGDGVARGYHERPELTAERFVDRPRMGRVYATGDVVRIHPAGHVEFSGRSDNQVKIRGHRIELGEVETVIDGHPGVVQSVVVARDDDGDTRLVAYVVFHHGAAVAADAIRKHVGESLPDAMVPSAVVALDTFPLTPNGKIDRKALPAPAAGSIEDLPRDVVPPAGGDEQLVADIWAEELERPVGRDDNFFDIGGHSLRAVKVFRRLSEATGAPLALTDVFRFPTVRAFAAHLAGLRGGEPTQSATAASSAPAGTNRGALRRRALNRRNDDGRD